MRLCLLRSRVLLTVVVVLYATLAAADELTFIPNTPGPVGVIDEIRVLARNENTRQIVTATNVLNPHDGITVDIPRGEGWQITVTVENFNYVGRRTFARDIDGSGGATVRVAYDADDFSNYKCGVPAVAPVRIRQGMIRTWEAELASVDWFLAEQTPGGQGALFPEPLRDRYAPQLQNARTDGERAAILGRAADELEQVIGAASSGLGTLTEDEIGRLKEIQGKLRSVRAIYIYKVKLRNQIKQSRNGIRKCEQRPTRRANKEPVRTGAVIDDAGSALPRDRILLPPSDYWRLSGGVGIHGSSGEDVALSVPQNNNVANGLSIDTDTTAARLSVEATSPTYRGYFLFGDFWDASVRTGANWRDGDNRDGLGQTGNTVNIAAVDGSNLFVFNNANVTGSAKFSDEQFSAWVGARLTRDVNAAMAFSMGAELRAFYRDQDLGAGFAVNGTAVNLSSEIESVGVEVIVTAGPSFMITDKILMTLAGSLGLTVSDNDFKARQSVGNANYRANDSRFIVSPIIGGEARLGYGLSPGVNAGIAGGFKQTFESPHADLGSLNNAADINTASRTEGYLRFLLEAELGSITSPR